MKKISEENFKHASLMGGRIPDSLDTVANFDKIVTEVGGTLHFLVVNEEDGWFAECNEFPAIIIGGVEKNPSNELIEERIRDVIHCAFNISSKIPSKDIISNGSKPLFKALYV
jgi:hypothetical protein